MFESREGILKHCSLKNAKKLGVIGDRFIRKKSAVDRSSDCQYSG